MAAPPTILPLIKARMPNEVLQHIVQCIQDGKTMHAFLSALPEAWHTEPMAALATLYAAVQSGQLADTSMTWLWPKVNMLNLTSIPKEFTPVFQAYAPMLPRVMADLDLHRQLRLPRWIPVERGRLTSFKEVATAVNCWAQQLVSVKLEQDPGTLPVQLICDVLPRLPKLRRLDVQWHATSSAAETSTLLHALCNSSVTELWLRYEPTSTLQWTAREVTAFTQWIQAKPVTAVGLVDVPIDAANARTLARTLLQSQTLKYLHVDMGQLPRALFNLGLSLPKQLESLNTYVRHLDDVLGATQTIAGSNLRKLIVGTPVPLKKNVELATNFMNAVTSLPRLRHLTIDHTSMPLPAVVQLSERLPSLTTLRLYNTSLDDAGISALASVLPRCRHLETLELSKQKCTYRAVELLANNIPQCPSLKNLNLRQNPIGSRSLCALLPVVRCLDTLSLQYCDIEDDGAYALCRVMDSTDHLYELNLDGSLFSKDAVKSIIRAVSTCATRWGTVCLDDIVDNEEELDKCLRCAEKHLRNESWCTLW